MMKSTVAKTVSEYIALAPKESRVVLKKLRAAIRAAAPKADEVISYQMPGYKYHGMLVYFAQQRDFCSFYGVGRKLLATFAKELKTFEVKGTTIHFTPDHPLSDALVKKMVKFRVKENEARAAAKIKK